MIVGLVNSKGGVGKTTLAVHLAAWIQDRGVAVALVDADTQGASSTWLGEASPRTARFRLQTPDDILDHVPAMRREFALVIVDGPAGLSEVTRAILLVADRAWLPCGPSALDLRAASEAIRVVHQAHRIRQDAPRALLVPNKLQARYRLSRELLASTQSLGVPATSGLRLRQAYADAAGQGQVVWRLGPTGAAATNEIKELFDGQLGDLTQNPQRSLAHR